MTSRLKKCYNILSGKDKRRRLDAEKRAPLQEWENKINRLTAHGAQFQPDNLVRLKENIAFRISTEVIDNTDFLVLLEIFCDGLYFFQLDKKEKITVFDIGMNIGAATLYFANMENVADVYSFEPFMPTFNRAVENIALNPRLAAKIHPQPIGLGKENKTLEIPYSRDFAGDMSTTVDRLEFHEKRYQDAEQTVEKVDVQDSAAVLAPIFNSLKTDRVVLKIDTEGAEFDILESLDAASLLPRIDYIMMEYHFRSPQPLEETLIRNGFIVFYRDLYREGVQNGMMYGVNIRRQ